MYAQSRTNSKMWEHDYHDLFMEQERSTMAKVGDSDRIQVRGSRLGLFSLYDDFAFNLRNLESH